MGSHLKKSDILILLGALALPASAVLAQPDGAVPAEPDRASSGNIIVNGIPTPQASTTGTRYQGRHLRAQGRQDEGHRA